VAKRSVKRERQRSNQNCPRPQPAASAAAPAKRPRGFWLGVLVAAALLIPAGIVAVLIASGGDDSAPAAQEPSSVETEAEALRRQTQVRDREQVQELTERMRTTIQDLQPVISGMAETFPPGEDDRTGPVASQADVQEWRRLVREADAYFENPPSGETGTNVARGGFSASVDALLGATETYRLALAQPGARDQLLERAREQRNLAVRTWSVAATQLDAINIATGFGHQHVYLGGTEESGGFGADPAPEGSGAEPHEDE
jgi:hypothetical protein